MLHKCTLPIDTYLYHALALRFTGKAILGAVSSKILNATIHIGHIKGALSWHNNMGGTTISYVIY